MPWWKNPAAIVLFLMLVQYLGGCDQAPTDERTIKLVLVKTEAEIKKNCGDDMILEPMGCAKLYGTRCTIVVKDVRGGYDDTETLSYWGHELRHCFKGRVHD